MVVDMAILMLHAHSYKGRIKTRTSQMLDKCSTVGTLPSPQKAGDSSKNDLIKHKAYRAHGIGICDLHRNDLIWMTGNK